MKKNLAFGLIFGIAMGFVALFLDESLSRIAETSHVFGYTISTSLVIFYFSGILRNKNWSYFVKGLALGIVSYITLVLPVIIGQSFTCYFASDPGMCPLFTLLAVLYFAPVIPLAIIVGWIVGRKKGEKHAAGLFWLKGGIITLVIWLLAFFISEYFHFYSRNPDLWDKLFFNRGEVESLWIYILIGVAAGFIYGKIKLYMLSKPVPL